MKAVLNFCFLALAFPLAMVCRIGALFGYGAQLSAMIPGLPGDYFRAAFYHLTLDEFPMTSRISFGSFFARRQARVGSRVYIGSYCVLGSVRIGDRSQIGSAVQILSGRRQHPRDSYGRIGGAEHGEFSAVDIGPDCWIGAAAIVMADVGPRCTVGAGSIVVKPVPADSTAVGNPARVIRTETYQPDGRAQPECTGP